MSMNSKKTLILSEIIRKYSKRPCKKSLVSLLYLTNFKCYIYLLAQQTSTKKKL